MSGRHLFFEVTRTIPATAGPRGCRAAPRGQGHGLVPEALGECVQRGMRRVWRQCSNWPGQLVELVIGVQGGFDLHDGLHVIGFL